MKYLQIAVPDALYVDLEQAALATREMGYSAEDYACDLVVSELAARRLPKVSMGSLGARIGSEPTPEVVGYRVVRPERMRA